MSNQLRFVLVALAVMCASEPARAQGRDSERTRALRHELDSVLPMLKTADSAFQVARDSVKRAEEASAAEVLDSVSVGPFMVVARPGVIRRAEAHVGELWRELETTLAGAESSFSNVTFLVETGEPVKMFTALDAQPHHLRLNIPMALKPGAQRVYVRRIFGAELSSALPTEFEFWLKGASLSWEDNLTPVYRELATARASSSRRCFASDRDSCMAALGLLPSDSLWSNWYTPAELRHLVAGERFAGVRKPLRDECLKMNAVQSCANYLRTGGGAPWPLSPIVRASLLTFALSQGGRGSFARLQATQGDIATRMSAAAGRPIDQVITDWRKAVEDSRPDIHAGVINSRLAVLFWVVLALGLAMRSTRWRLA